MREGVNHCEEGVNHALPGKHGVDAFGSTCGEGVNHCEEGVNHC